MALLWFSGCLNFVARVMVTTMHGSLVAAFPMNEARFGLLTAAFLIAYGVTSPFAGFCSDRFSRSRVIWVSLLCWSILTWTTSFTTTYGELLCMRVALGFAEAFYLPAALSLITDYHRNSTRSLAVGLHLTGTLSGVTLGGVGGWLSELKGWGFAFQAVGLTGVLYGILLCILLRDVGPDRRQSLVAGKLSEKIRLWTALSTLIGSGPFMLATLYWALLGVTSWGLVGWLPMLYHEQFGMSQSAAGFYATFWSNAACVLGLVGGGAWADSWARSESRATMLVPAIAILVALPFILFAINTRSMGLSLAGMAFYGFAGGCASSTMMPILCLIADSKYRATGYGTLNMVGTIAGGVSVYSVGALRDLHFNLRAILIGTVACMAFCPVLLMAIRPGSRDHETGEI